MVRTLACAAVCLLFFAGSLPADEATKEIKGIVKKYDADNGTLVVLVDDKEHTVNLGADTKFVDESGRTLDADTKTEQLVQGAQVTITTQKSGGKQGTQQITQVQVKTIKIKKKGTRPEQKRPEQKKDSQ